MVNGHGRQRILALAAHGFIVNLDGFMRAGLMMFARFVMAAVTLLVFVVVASIKWRGTIGMPLFAIALAASEKMRRAREMLANLQPSAASGRDKEG